MGFTRRIFLGLKKIKDLIVSLIGQHNNSLDAHFNGFNHDLIVSKDEDPALILKESKSAYNEINASDPNSSVNDTAGLISFHDKGDRPILSIHHDHGIVFPNKIPDTFTVDNSGNKSYFYNRLAFIADSVGDIPFDYDTLILFNIETYMDLTSNTFDASTTHITVSPHYTPQIANDLTTKRYVDETISFMIGSHNEDMQSHPNGFNHNITIKTNTDPALILRQTKTSYTSDSINLDAGLIVFKDINNVSTYTIHHDSGVEGDHLFTRVAFIAEPTGAMTVAFGDDKCMAFDIQSRIYLDNNSGGSIEHHLVACSTYVPTWYNDLTTKKYVDEKATSKNITIEEDLFQYAPNITTITPALSSISYRGQKDTLDKVLINHEKRIYSCENRAGLNTAKLIEVYIDPHGNDESGTGSASHPFFSINRAVEYFNTLRFAITDVVMRIIVNPGIYEYHVTQFIQHPDCGISTTNRIELLGNQYLYYNNNDFSSLEDTVFIYRNINTNPLDQWTSVIQIRCNCYFGGFSVYFDATNDQNNMGMGIHVYNARANMIRSVGVFNFGLCGIYVDGNLANFETDDRNDLVFNYNYSDWFDDSVIVALANDTRFISGKTYYTYANNTYTPVTTATYNPSTLGWYEANGDFSSYSLTNDTTVTYDKQYYIYLSEKQDYIHTGPKYLGLYERPKRITNTGRLVIDSNRTYGQTMGARTLKPKYYPTSDTTFVSNKTYYTWGTDSFITYNRATTGNPSESGLYEYKEHCVLGVGIYNTMRSFSMIRKGCVSIQNCECGFLVENSSSLNQTPAERVYQWAFDYLIMFKNIYTCVACNTGSFACYFKGPWNNDQGEYANIQDDRKYGDNIFYYNGLTYTGNDATTYPYKQHNKYYYEIHNTKIKQPMIIETIGCYDKFIHIEQNTNSAVI